MNASDPKKAEMRSIGQVSRRAINTSPEAMTKTEYLRAEKPSPLIVRPAAPGVNLPVWAGNNRPFIEKALNENGGILFRGFGVKRQAEFDGFLSAVSDGLLEYSYGSTPRTMVGNGIYTSTEYPAAHTIPLHNEMSYSTSWPMKIWFFCLAPAEFGGETPVAYGRRVFERISPVVKERFMRKKVMYVRNYGEGLDLPWQKVFRTNDRSEVEAFCRRVGIDFEWKSGERLTTRQVCQAVATHPVTGEVVWFNQAHLFHVSSLAHEVRHSLLTRFDEDDLPRNAYYGDGSPIEDPYLAEVRGAYESETLIFKWEQGDVLMLDNMLMAHGRRSFSGERKILVGMAQPSGDQEAQQL